MGAEQTLEQVIVPQSIADLFLAQGVIGAVALIAILVSAFLYRAKDKAADKHDVAIVALTSKYEAQLAAKDVAAHKLQEDRIAEMKAGMVEMGKAMQTVEQVTAGFEAALDALSKRRGAS